MSHGYNALLLSTAVIAFLHAVMGPDHYVPFIALASTRRWSRKFLSLVTIVGALLHAGSSVVLGTLGILGGIALTRLEVFEALRGDAGRLLLVAFGLAYMAWGMMRRRHRHVHVKPETLVRRTTVFWSLYAVFVLGPCEPLVPLMFAASSWEWQGVAGVALLFTAVTLATMLVMVHAGSGVARRYSFMMSERLAHVMAGGIITATGVALWWI